MHQQQILTKVCCYVAYKHGAQLLTLGAPNRAPLTGPNYTMKMGQRFTFLLMCGAKPSTSASDLKGL